MTGVQTCALPICFPVTIRHLVSQSRYTLRVDEFAGHVSTYRGLSVEAIKGLDAKVFTASKAKANGLVDEVMTNNEFAAFVAKVHKDTLNEG